MKELEVDEAVDRLLQAYSTYYDVERCSDGNLVAGFDGVAAAQLVISALLFVLAVFLMVGGLRVLNEQRRARLSESA